MGQGTNLSSNVFCYHALWDNIRVENEHANSLIYIYISERKADGGEIEMLMMRNIDKLPLAHHLLELNYDP